jgi:predicted dehydrogenase
MHRILVIGVGSIGERHVRCLKGTGRVRLGICEINDRLREEVAARYGIESSYHDLDEALEAEWSAAVVATPAHLHIAQALRCVRAGLHLLIEKPLSATLEGTAVLTDEVHKRNLTAGVAYVYRTHPALVSMHRAVVARDFGEPVQVSVVAGQHFPFYRPAYRQIYYRDRATGGGAVQDALTHMVNAVEWLVGPMTWVAADACHKVLQGVEVEDTVTAIARHREVLTSYSLNQHQAPSETAITVVGERGAARFEAHRVRWRWAREPGSEWRDEQFGPLERDAWMTLQASAFLDAVESRGPLPCSLDEGLQTLRATQAILRSIEAGSAPARV